MLNTFGNPQCSIVTFRICWLVKYQYLDLILLQTAKWHFQQLHKCKTCRGPDICTHYTRHPYSCTFFLLKSIVPSKMSTTVWNTFPLFGRACKQLISSRFLLHTIGQTMFSQLATGNKNYKMYFSFFSLFTDLCYAQCEYMKPLEKMQKWWSTVWNFISDNTCTSI